MTRARLRPPAVGLVSAIPIRRRRTGVPASWRQHWPLVLIAAVTTVLSVVVRHSYLRFGYSGDADEGTYVWQARTLLQGHLTVSGQAFSGPLRPWLTGEAHGRVFSEYWPGWSGMLAASAWLTGKMAVAPLVAALAWVVAVYALGWELFSDRRVAVTASALLGISPILLLHSALYLPYACVAALLTGSACLILRGVRLTSRPALIGGGVLAGVALICRPFDVVLAAVPCMIYLLKIRPSTLRLSWSAARWIAAGAAPFVLLLLGFDFLVTGSAFRSPLSLSDPLNRFGFGQRRIMPGEPVVSYSPSVAWTALRANLHGMASWLVGGPVLAVLSVAGAFARSHRPKRLFLVGFAAAFPVGYFFWWGAALAAHGAVNGIGPHYYLPAFGPVVLLAAERIVWFATRVPAALGQRRTIAVGMLAVAVGAVLTTRAVSAKIDNQRIVNGFYASAKAVLPAHGPAPTLIVVSPNSPSNYVGKPYPIFINDHGANAPLLYAADQGTIGYQLGLLYPDRKVIRLRPSQPPDPPSTSAAPATALTTVRGVGLCVTADFTSPAAPGYAYGYLRTDRRSQRTAAVPISTTQHRFRHTWRLSAADLASGPQYVTVGLATSSLPGAEPNHQWEQRLSAGPADGQIAAQFPGFQWQLSAGPAGDTWREVSVTSSVRVSIIRCDRP